MKKVLLCLLLLSWNINVQAATYSEYSSYSAYSDEEVESNDLTDVKIERRYKYYKYNKVYSDYASTITEDYPYLDEEDYIYSEYSDWQTSSPEELDGRDIEKRTIYTYENYGPIEKTQLEVGTDLYINSIKFYDDGKEIEYTYETSDGASLEYIPAGGSITFIFDHDVAISDLKAKLIINSTSNVKYEICYHNYGNGTEYQRVSTTISSIMSTASLSTDFSYFVLHDYDTIETAEELETSKYLVLKKTTDEYRYRDKLYHLYTLEKEYYPEYLTEAYEDYTFKDEEDYKDYYAYRTRYIIEDTVKTTVEPKSIERVVEALSKNKKEVSAETSSLDTAPTLESVSTFSDIGSKTVTDTKEEPENETVSMWQASSLLLVPIGIFILLLSKLRKRKQKRARV